MKKLYLLILVYTLLSSSGGIITQAHGGNGVFSGKCIMRVSNFNILLKSHFDDISINESYQVTAGTVIADRGPGIMINLDDLIPAIDSLANIPPDSIVAHIDDFIDVADSLVYEIEPAIVSDSLQIVLEDLQETLQTVVGDTSLTDQQQNEIQNLIDHIESLLNQTIEGSDNPTFVMFKEFPEQTYGFDEPDSSLTSLYQYYQPPNNVGGTDQFIRWKSIKAGNMDKVFARLDSANTTIKFYGENDIEIIPEAAESNDTLKVLQLTGAAAEGTSIIRAEININDTTTQVVGMLNLITYPEKTTNLVVVPVNGNNLPGGISSTEFKAQLDEIYGVAAMTWNITLGQNISFDYAIADQTATFNAWPTGGTPYTADMSTLIAQLVTSGNYDENNYYLFLVNNSEISGQMGIMPFSQQYAFVFADKFNQDGRFIKTSAHELAHGIFNLEHQYKFHTGIDTFATPNLMTYHPTATNLNKYQWDRVQNPLDRGYHDAGDARQINNSEFYTNNFARTVKFVQCGKKKNEHDVSIYHDIKDLTVTYGNLAEKLFGQTIEYYPNEKIDLFVTNDNTTLFSYFEDTYDINAIQFDDSRYKITIPGNNNKNIIISLSQAPHKNIIYTSFLKRLFNETVNLTPSETIANSFTIDELQWEPVCTYEQINDNRRKILLTELSKKTRLNDKLEKVAVNLFKSAKSHNDIFNFINDNTYITNYFYKEINTYKNDFYSSLSDLCANVWNKSDYENANYFVLEEYILDDFFPDFTLPFYNNNVLKVIGIYKPEDEIYGFASQVWSSNNGGLSWPEQSTPIGEYEVNALSPIVINIKGKQGVSPAIEVKYLAENKHNEVFWDFIAFNVGLLLPELYISSKARMYRGVGWSEEAVGSTKLWTHIDEADGLFKNNMATYYDVNVTYQATRPRAGVAFENNNILELHLKIPEKLQGQGIGTEIFMKAKGDYFPSKVKGWWKESDIYTGGESINLTIFKQKINEGLSPINAAFETPSGKIFKRNGFGGTPEIIKNTPEEVIIHFNPTN